MSLYVAVHYHQQSQPNTEAKKNETAFVVGVLWIRNHPSVLVEECGLGLLEGDAVLPLVLRRLAVVPLERQIALAPSVTTT